MLLFGSIVVLLAGRRAGRLGHADQGRPGSLRENRYPSLYTRSTIFTGTAGSNTASSTSWCRDQRLAERGDPLHLVARQQSLQLLPDRPDAGDELVVGAAPVLQRPREVILYVKQLQQQRLFLLPGRFLRRGGGATAEVVEVGQRAQGPRFGRSQLLLQSGERVRFGRGGAFGRPFLRRRCGGVQGLRRFGRVGGGFRLDGNVCHVLRLVSFVFGDKKKGGVAPLRATDFA